MPESLPGDHLVLEKADTLLRRNERVVSSKYRPSTGRDSHKGFLVGRSESAEELRVQRLDQVLGNFGRTRDHVDRCGIGNGDLLEAKQWARHGSEPIPLR